MDFAKETFFVKNEAETVAVAEKLASTLNGGELIVFDGDLGAGKTFFTGALCEALGVDRKKVSSPTFVIMKKYSGKFDVYHWDFYRISSVDELYIADFPEYLKAENSVTIVEWADMFKECWEAHRPRIEIKIRFGIGENEREISIGRID
ncbi:tRNA (adenosine(37)-N6)-threonylcarbamoyltransferase complex ATPase subunit type 1 TsaE [bacterium]|nr:tRNA (adenosine(37)-N6)-threonylcarbamoyltransferase complex ATPase subunit type 1 TsaE [bacterium]MBP5591720.1 tRNA (adenosine(37)-N6)-threonylcarbamoyltransferase complex ATPase subunit type 1 TsaE [bacterium]